MSDPESLRRLDIGQEQRSTIIGLLFFICAMLVAIVALLIWRL